MHFRFRNEKLVVGMSTDPIAAEREAFESMSKLLEQAEECRRLFERANLTFPETLKRVLGMNGTSRTAVRLYIPPIERNSRPPEALDNWLSISVKEAMPTSIVKAALRAANEPIPARKMVDIVTSILPVPAGTVYNVGPRLEASKLILRSKQGWLLISKEQGGVLHDGFLWGPEGIFEKTEIAAHRREAILHLLQCNRSGLQVAQLVEHLQSCKWVHAPVNKDLLKGDIEELRKDGKVRRVGNSKKWEASDEK